MLLVMFIIAFLLTALMRAGVDILFLNQVLPKTSSMTSGSAFCRLPTQARSQKDTDNSMPMKIVGIVTILLGMIFFSGVIAFITTELDKMSDLRRTKRST